ncbi:MAG: hypothetical protein Q4C00_03910 [Bacillota bacterium]|nr:hypothetical protein [Bacillota bacterium]
MRSAIDVGSNSLRLLVVDESGKLFRQEVAETRLGEGFRQGSITSGAMDRTIEVIEEWQRQLLEQDCHELAIFATSAVRDAANRDEFCRLVKNRTGLELDILSGDEEAWYSFSGAVGSFNAPKDECLLIDIGGGSTEMALYQNGEILCFSVPLGAVRWKVMAKKLLSKKVSTLDTANISNFIAVGGTATTAAAICTKTAAYSRKAIHGIKLSRKQIASLENELEAMPLTERREVVGLPEARADIIVFGLAILGMICDLMNIKEITVSDHGILDGYLAAH